MDHCTRSLYGASSILTPAVLHKQLSFNYSDTVRATAVGRDAERNAERNAVLAGDPKGLDYYVILL